MCAPPGLLPSLHSSNTQHCFDHAVPTFHSCGYTHTLQTPSHSHLLLLSKHSGCLPLHQDPHFPPCTSLTSPRLSAFSPITHTHCPHRIHYPPLGVASHRPWSGWVWTSLRQTDKASKTGLASSLHLPQHGESTRSCLSGEWVWGWKQIPCRG